MFSPDAADRPIAFRNGAPILLAEFRQNVAAITARLPSGAYMINLCDDRYHFLAAYAAAAIVGHTVLLPSSRAPQIVAEVEAVHPGSYRFDDAMVDAALCGPHPAPQASRPTVAADHIVMIGFTSGSSGAPRKFPKLWRSVNASTAYTAAVIRSALGGHSGATPWVLATVPPQHMYGMELSVLPALLGEVAVHAGRPLFPADIARALTELPAPRVLVSTPVHLRVMVESPQDFPTVDLIISATAPLDRTLAAAVEHKLSGRLLEVFGSTETCVFASRRTALEHAWRLYEGVTLRPESDGTLVNAPWFAAPMMLPDIVELQDDDRFIVRGRNTDMIEVAGKRASLGDLTRRLLAIEGVKDAVVFQPEQESIAAIRRVAALVVAPALTAQHILDRLAASVDAAFLPRPLLMVDSLPRNELGKLPRERLLRALNS